MSEPDLGRLLVAAQRTRPRRERGCPRPEELIAAAAGELAAPAREAVAAHLSVCADCAAEYSLAGELHVWAREVGAADGVPRDLRRLRASPRIWLPLAASLLVAALGLAVWNARREAPPEELRGAAEHSWEVVPSDEAVLAARPQRLDWPQVPGADSYDVVVFDHESRPLYRSGELETTTLELPAEVELRPGQTYYWRVTARLGIVEERSPLFSFTLGP